MNKMPMESFSSYTDLNGLRSISQKKGETGAGLEAAAKQFESIYLNMMLESMRKAERIWAEDNPFSNQTVHFYQDMMDNQLSVNLSQQRGVGLADMIIKQFGKYVDVDSKLEDESGSEVEPIKKIGSIPETNLKPLDKSAPILLNSMQFKPTINIDSKTSDTEFKTPEAFIKSVLPEARKAAEKLGIDPNILVAQAALETGWGKHFVKTSLGENSHNLFGIKANKSWVGDVAWSKTHEYQANTQQLEKTSAGFRVYPNYAQSFEDYVSLIKDSDRYSEVLVGEKNASSYLSNLQKSGYATDPDYANKILSILNSGRFEANNDRNKLVSNEINNEEIRNKKLVNRNMVRNYGQFN